MAYANANQTISFDVANGNDFYNDVIKESNYYVSKLDYKVDEYVAIGFLIKDNHLFEYKIKDNNVIIMATQSYYSSIEKDLYIINFPLKYELHINKNEDLLDYYNYAFDELITFDMALDIANCIQNDSCMIINNCIYLKGIVLDDSKKVNYSNEFLISLYDNNGKIGINYLEK